MSEEKRIAVDQSKIRRAAQTGMPLSITTYTLPHEMEVYINEVIALFLKELNQEKLTDYISYCVNELTTNAKKANTKRIYFKEQGLSINELKDYKEGMKHFKADTLGNIAHYLELQKQAGLYVKILLQVKNQKIRIEVRNNSSMNVFEYKRIHDKITRANQFTSLEQALTDVIDESEGAGLGLIIMILMLKKIGLTEENYQTFVENNETVTRIILPLDAHTKEGLAVISGELVKLISELPQFPDNINIINRLLNDPDSKLSEIAMHVSNDAALTADLLKLVNSAAFSLTYKCHSISEAVKMVGIKGLKNLLYSIGTMQILGNSTPEQKNLWAHCYRVAFYSYNLSKNFANTRSVIEDSYVCGLLHDMGKIIFSNVRPEFREKIKALCTSKNIPDALFESIISGINHAEVGALIAEKWNFPASIVESVRYHHDPENASEENRRLVSIIYLANILSHYQEGTVEYYQVDGGVLRSLGITSEATLNKISKQLSRAFEQELTK